VSRGLGYYWRLLATGYNFAFFGLGGFVLALTALPLARCWPGSEQARNARARRVLHHAFRYFVWQMRITGVISLELRDIEKLRTGAGQLVIANHPTLIDVVLLVALLPDSCCIVKDALWKNPLLKGVVRATGYINNNADPERLLSQCGQSLRAGHSIIVFPEGTRTRPGQPLRFRRGAAHIAVRCGVDIVPVTIRCDPPMLRKGERWYQIPARRAQLRVSVGDTLAVAAIVGDAAAPALATRRLNRHLQNYYQSVCVNA